MTEKKDNWDSTMSREETYALLEAADVEFEKGNEEAGYALLYKIPLAPSLAMCYATQVGLGPEALKKSKLNLADADKKFGPDWLERLANEKHKRWTPAP